MLVGFKIFYVLSLFSSGNSHISTIGNEMKLASESTYMFVFYLLRAGSIVLNKRVVVSACVDGWKGAIELFFLPS